MKIALIALLMTSLSFAEETKTNPRVSEKMQKLYLTLSDILVNSSSSERFSNPKNRSAIEDQLKTLSTLSHSMNDREFKGNSTDPTLTILSGYLSDETKTAFTAFKNGKYEFSRGIVRSLPGTCIACHSRNDSGAQFDQLAIEPSDQSLKPMERAEFYAATRQFDRAEKDFLKIIEDQQIASTDPYTWEHAIRQSLTIAVRVKKNPQMAKKIVEAALAQKKSSYYIRSDLQQWNHSIEQWIKEMKKTPKSETGMLAEGMRLITEAHKLQKYPMDHSADILYLRASTVFYDLIQKAPTGKNVSQALMMEGICNEVLSPKGFQDLHRLYYESCIRKSPNSPIAMDCYRRYEQSTVQGYTGSAGTSVPEDIKQKLLDLFSLSVSKGSVDQVY